MRIKLLALYLILSFSNSMSQNIPLYIGTYTDGRSEGIYKLDFDTNTGSLTNLQLAVATQSPSFIAYSPNRKFLYAVNESLEGFVTAYKIQENGQLKFLNKVNSNGKDPCHISLNKQGTKAVVSNYSGGSATIFNISRNGKLGEASQIFKYGSSNQKSHAHSAQFFKDELFVADLGMNTLYQYKLKNDNYELASSEIVKMEGNPGPRHFAITKNGQYIYIINEYGSTVTSLKRTDSGFDQIDEDSTLEANYTGKNSCADIHLSKNEVYLYGSNRGENSIVVYKRNKTNGTIEKIQSVPVQGDSPRNFSLDPTGKFLLAANQKSHNITVFKIEPTTGQLSFLSDVKVPSPVCLLF